MVAGISLLLVADGCCVVQSARETLENAIRMVEASSKWKARVVYGDTDSMFVLLPGRYPKPCCSYPPATFAPSQPLPDICGYSCGIGLSCCVAALGLRCGSLQPHGSMYNIKSSLFRKFPHSFDKVVHMHLVMWPVLPVRHLQMMAATRRLLTNEPCQEHVVLALVTCSSCTSNCM